MYRFQRGLQLIMLA